MKPTIALPVVLILSSLVACSHIKDTTSNGFCSETVTEDCTDVLDPSTDENTATESSLSPAITCAADNDCDGDGVYTSCDEDDEDADNDSVKAACDDDADGYVDLSCAAYDSARDENGDGKISVSERDVNCDVCVGEYDPDQTDSDENGVGDACEYEPSTNESDEEESSDTDSATDTGTDVDGDDDDTEVGDGEELIDADGDGLASTIDPDDSIKNDWGYINRDTGKKVCLAEQEGYEYVYIEGSRAVLSVLSQKINTPKAGILSGKKDLDTNGDKGIGRIHNGPLSNLVRVDGVVDRNLATLDTIAYGGISCSQDMEYGIYIVTVADNNGGLQIGPKLNPNTDLKIFELAGIDRRRGE